MSTDATDQQTAARFAERARGRLAVRAVLGVRGADLLVAGEPVTPEVQQAVAALGHPAREQRARALAGLMLRLGRALEARWWR